MINTTQGNITLGAQGVEGDVVVKDRHDRRVFVVDGSDASATIGAAGNEGDIRVMDAAGQPSMRVDGATGTVLQKRIAPIAGNAIDVDAFAFRIHGGDLILDGRSGGNKRALVDLGNRLEVNYANDYANGVTINKLHLSDHVKLHFWDERSEFNPPHVQWTTFFEMDTQLPAAEWDVTSQCEIGMWDKGSVNNFWWQTDNVTFVSNAGTWVVKWNVEINDGGNDWIVWQRSVMWIAVRR